jgi:hypothetical protein
MEANWLDSYYEALEFFYWEPQHIGRKKHVSAEFDTLDKVTRHLRRMEVTLNHNINQFFLLAPTALRNELFRELFARTFDRPFVMRGRGVDAEFELVNSMQPDFLFASDTELVALEMKVRAKSSVSQVLKYALLGLAVEMRVGAPRHHYLALLGAGEFANQWQEQFASIAELRHAIASTDLASFLSKQPIRFREHQARFNEIVEHLHLAFINYPRFVAFLRSAAPPPSDESPGAEVYRKLISGLLVEFNRRQLVI